MSAVSTTNAPTMPLIIIVTELLRRSISRAVCGAISPAKDISPVTLIMEPTIRVENASTAARTGFNLTPNARHSLSLRDINSICRLSSSMPISPIRNMGSMERSFESVVFPNVPISQYSIAASSFSGSAKYLSAIIMALDMAFITMPASTYVLAGIVINAISKAIIMALKYFADPENELAAMEYWEMGTFGNTTLSKLLSILPMFLIGLIGILLLRRQIELMSLSDNECRALGVRLKPVRAAVLAFSTLMVGSIISVTGLISFAGLIAPHTARLMLRRNNSVTIIMSGMVGAFVVLTADILARVLYSAELPISILTTVIGVPILVYFLCTRGKETA